MKRKVGLVVLVFFCALKLSAGSEYSRQESNILTDILVKPGTIYSTIVLDSKAPLYVMASAYEQAGAVIVLDLDGVKTDLQSRKSSDPRDFVQQIIVEKPDPEKIQLRFILKEKVPYRIYLSGIKTIIELNHIQRSIDRYVLDPEIMQVFEKQSPQTVRLEGLDFSELSDRIDITARMSGEVIPQIFTLQNPLRLVLDLYDTLNFTKQAAYDIKKLGVAAVRAAQFERSEKFKITRLVLNLDEPTFYSLETGPKRLKLSFYKNAFALSSTPSMTIETAQAYLDSLARSKTTRTENLVAKPTRPGQKTGTEIKSGYKTDPIVREPLPKTDIRDTKTAAEKGEAVKTAEIDRVTSIPATEDEKKTLNKSAKDLPPAPKKQETEKSVSLKEEPPAVTAPPKSEEIKTKQIEENAQEYQVSPPVTSYTNGQSISNEPEGYSGQLVSLRFREMDLRDVILTLGNIAGLNVVFNPEVRGTVTCDLVDIPWDQAMDILLKENKMGRTIEGNVLRIAPINVLTKEQEDDRKLAESRELSGPTVTRIFELSYAQVTEVNDLLANKISERGEVIIDGRTNTLIITDVKDRMALIERLVAVFDQATPQVSIEARIIEATSNFIRNLGVQWGTKGVADPFYGNQTSLQFPNKILVDGALIPQGIATRGIGGPLGGYGINLPAPSFSTAVGLSFGNVLDTFRLDVALSALETSGEGRIISSPMITTLNNKQAEIIQGRQIPLQTTANFTVTTRYSNAALELRATPQITAEGTVILQLDIQNNAADFANLVNGIPPLITQRANTTMTVPDGGTRVIGGIYRTEDSITYDKVPFLHKIPLLGNLFKSSSRTKQNRELLIFITPRIIR